MQAMRHRPHLANDIDAEAAVLRARLAAIRRLKTAGRKVSLRARLEADPELRKTRSEAARRRALNSVRALPAMTPEQRRAYAKLRWNGLSRADAIEAVKAHE